ncbi:MAG: hypothetical protein ABIF40_05270 [archaeon]
MPRDNTKSKRIILELLHHPKGDLTKYRIAKETQTNISWVITFLKKLEAKKLVKVTKVTNYDKLIDFYLQLEPELKTYEFMLKEPIEYLKKTKRKYLLTTYGAENFTSHHLFLSRVDIYIKKEDLDTWKKELFKKGLVGKGNLRLIIPHDEYIFKFVEKRKGLNLVTIPLLMIDLKKEGGVCIQAYEYLTKYV